MTSVAKLVVVHCRKPAARFVCWYAVVVLLAATFLAVPTLAWWQRWQLNRHSIQPTTVRSGGATSNQQGKVVVRLPLTEGETTTTASRLTGHLPSIRPVQPVDGDDRTKVLVRLSDPAGSVDHSSSPSVPTTTSLQPSPSGPGVVAESTIESTSTSATMESSFDSLSPSSTITSEAAINGTMVAVALLTDALKGGDSDSRVGAIPSPPPCSDEGMVEIKQRVATIVAVLRKGLDLKSKSAGWTRKVATMLSASGRFFDTGTGNAVDASPSSTAKKTLSHCEWRLWVLRNVSVVLFSGHVHFNLSSVRWQPPASPGGGVGEEVEVQSTTSQLRTASTSALRLHQADQQHSIGIRVAEMATLGGGIDHRTLAPVFFRDIPADRRAPPPLSRKSAAAEPSSDPPPLPTHAKGQGDADDGRPSVADLTAPPPPAVFDMCVTGMIRFPLFADTWPVLYRNVIYPFRVRQLHLVQFDTALVRAAGSSDDGVRRLDGPELGKYLRDVRAVMDPASTRTMPSSWLMLEYKDAARVMSTIARHIWIVWFTRFVCQELVSDLSRQSDAKRLRLVAAEFVIFTRPDVWVWSALQFTAPLSTANVLAAPSNPSSNSSATDAEAPRRTQTSSFRMFTRPMYSTMISRGFALVPIENNVTLDPSLTLSAVLCPTRFHKPVVSDTFYLLSFTAAARVHEWIVPRVFAAVQRKQDHFKYNEELITSGVAAQRVPWVMFDVHQALLREGKLSNYEAIPVQHRSSAYRGCLPWTGCLPEAQNFFRRPRILRVNGKDIWSDDD